MPEFTPDLTTVTVRKKLLDPGEYEVKIGEPRARVYEHKGTGDSRIAVNYPLTLMGKIMADESIDRTDAGVSLESNTIFPSTKGGFEMFKRFLMAARGFVTADEELFDKEIGVSADTSSPIEGDEVTLGSGYQLPVGRIVRVRADQEQRKGRDTVEQDWKFFSPCAP